MAGVVKLNGNTEITTQPHTRISFCLLGYFRVNLHRSFNVRVSHKLLNQLNVCLDFTKTSTISMAQVMTRERRQQLRFTLFFFSEVKFMLIVITDNSCNRPIYSLWILNAPKTV